MTNQQLYLAIGIPIIVNILFNGILFTLFYQIFTHRIDRVENRMDRMETSLKELWRAELHRVEEVIDARLKHLEERERP